MTTTAECGKIQNNQASKQASKQSSKQSINQSINRLMNQRHHIVAIAYAIVTMR